MEVAPVFRLVSSHEFHPVRNGFTRDRDLGKDGVTSPDDLDWRVRTLAVRDLIREFTEQRERFEELGVAIVTIQCQDLYPARVMAREESLDGQPAKGIEWPHLVDRAGAVAARYGMQPMAYAVHAEYVNRPGVAIVDEAGVLRFHYAGTYWGDRPEVAELLEMFETGRYEYAAPRRLRPANP